MPFQAWVCKACRRGGNARFPKTEDRKLVADTVIRNIAVGHQKKNHDCAAKHGITKVVCYADTRGSNANS
jgi:hypothetical protein